MSAIFVVIFVFQPMWWGVLTRAVSSLKEIGRYTIDLNANILAKPSISRL